MKLAMFGTKDFALPTFRALADAGHEVLALVTQPDRPQGRKQELIASPIKLAASERGVPVLQPEDCNAAEFVASLRDLGPDLLVTAAYGQILSSDLLGVAPLGGANLHGSILPKYRGAAPVARAIQAGDPESGVTVIRMTPRIDAGGMIAVARTPIDPDETAGELEARLAEIGAPLMLAAIASLADGSARVMTQDKARVTRAPKLKKEDGRIDWTRPAVEIHNLVRAMNPWPLAGATWHPADRPPVPLIVHRSSVAEGQGPPGAVIEAGRDRLVVAAGAGAALLVVVQVPGKRPMPTAEFLRGHKVRVGEMFS